MRCSRPLAFLLLLAGGCSRREQVVVLWVAADTRGTVAPCGCTTDPLGGLDKMAALVRSEKAPHALLHSGPLERNPDAPLKPGEQAERDAKAALLSRTFAELGLLAPGIHPIGPVRLAVLEARQGQPLERPPDVDLAIALLDMPEPQARRLLKESPGVDIAVLGGQRVAEPTAIALGQTVLVKPATELQGLVRLEIHWKKSEGGRLVYAGGPGEVERLRAQIDRLDRQLARWDAGPGDSFITEQKAERAALAAELDRRSGRGGVLVPEHGGWFQLTLVPVRQALPSDPRVRAAMEALDRQMGELNRKRDCERPRPPPADPRYVGMASCGKSGCHPKALALWKTTVHAHAWATLIQDGRAFSHECIACHVTGYDQSGGATLCAPEPLQDVQCEVCHGPASLHVKAEGLDEPSTVHRAPPEELCRSQCHTPDHSDTFELRAYLRDILGEGHGAKRKAALGPGPTGHELRQAGLRKAGRIP